MSLLEVKGLTVAWRGAPAAAVEDLSFAIAPGEAVGMAGESGAGKTQAALALVGLSPAGAAVRGSVRFAGRELRGADEECLNRFRGRRIAMIFQDPLQALNPYLSIGRQLELVLSEHRVVPRNRASGHVRELLERVGLTDATRVAQSFPHQLSGGMRQRAMIALALSCGPELLIADEPTTALDVTVQAEILALIARERTRTGMALLLITHDLGVIAEACERLLVLERGRLVEQGSLTDLLRAPAHPATRALVAAAPAIEEVAPPPSFLASAPVLEVRDVAVEFRAPGRRRPPVGAVRGVSLGLGRGETLAIAGESGAGKTTLARAVLGLVAPDRGRILHRGRPLPPAIGRRSLAERRVVQAVFQDPASSLDPAMTVGRQLAEVLARHRPAARWRDRVTAVGELLEQVGLETGHAGRLPHELSGGQAQRVSIARALIPRPDVLVCDEAVAALDGVSRAGILALLAGLQREQGLGLLFITHDLGVVRRIAHRVLVMYMGRACEVAPNDALFRRPRHPYTRLLIDSLPVADPERRILGRHSPHTAALSAPAPGGCPFLPRCGFAIARCRTEPPLVASGASEAACHRADELDLGFSINAREGESAPARR